MYYVNLNLGSTYLLATVSIGVVWVVTAAYGYLKPESQIRVNTFKSFIYNFFIMGATIAGCLAFEGAILNPITGLSVGAGFYVAGILLYVGIFVEIIYSIATNRNVEYLSSYNKKKIK